MTECIRIFAAICQDKRAVTAVEYGIMAALISAVLVTAIGTLTGGLSAVFTRLSGYLT